MIAVNIHVLYKLQSLFSKIERFLRVLFPQSLRMELSRVRPSRKFPLQCSVSIWILMTSSSASNREIEPFFFNSLLSHGSRITAPSFLKTSRKWTVRENNGLYSTCLHNLNVDGVGFTLIWLVVGSACMFYLTSFDMSQSRSIHSAM